MNRILEAIARMILLAIVAGTVAAGYLVYRLVALIIQTIDGTIGPAFWLAIATVLFVAFAVVVIGGSLYIVAALRKHLRQTHARNGLYPVEHGWNPNEPGAQSLAVMAQVRRVTAAQVGRVIDAQYRNAVDAMPEQLAALQPPSLTVADVATVNQRTNPHWLLVGASGSGKTTAAYAIVSEIARTTGCEFVICEFGGVHWHGAASTAPEIVRALISVQAEVVRRQEALKAAEVEHVEDLIDPPRTLVLLADELDTTLDKLKLLVQQRERAMAIDALRDVARLGRKCGVYLFAISTAGTTDVFDPVTRKQIGTWLFFRNEHTVSETFRLGDVRLTKLPSGTAYSLRHGAMVRFPYASRPRLPLASLAIEALAEHESTGIPVQWPVYHHEPATDSGIPVFSTDDRSAYTPAQIAHIRSRHAALGSIKAVERELYSQDGGYWFYRLKDVV